MRSQMTQAATTREASAAVVRELTVATYAQLLRAEADEILAARGVLVRTRTIHRIAEIEAP